MSKVRHIALTGAGGFIGRRVADWLLAEGHMLKALTRSPERARQQAGLTWVEGDLTTASPGTLGAFLEGCDVLVHMAGEINDPSVMQALHVDGTKRLIDAAQGCVRHWVQLSSCGVYGPVRAGRVDEKAPLAPVGPYEETKELSERLVLDAARSGQFSATVLRPSIVYGADMPNNSLRALVSAVQRGLFFYIGAPGATYNCIHVSDVAEILARSSVDPAAENRTFNLSTCHTIETLTGCISEITGCPPPRWRVPEGAARLLAATLGRLPGFPLTGSRVEALTSRAVYSDDAVRTALDWQPKVSLREGLAELVAAMDEAR